MLLQRLDNQYEWEAPKAPEPPTVAARRMWSATVSYGPVPALRCACDSFGADRLLLGTDFFVRIECAPSTCDRIRE